MMCHHGGKPHDYAVETAGIARCPEHGVTLLWHGEPITDSELAEAMAGESRMNDALAAEEAMRGNA